MHYSLALLLDTITTASLFFFFFFQAEDGIRDVAVTGVQTCALPISDVDLGTGAHLRCHGKGRKERITPLTTQACGVLRVWLSERRGEPGDPLFPSRRRGPLSRDAVALLVAKHAGAATQRCPSVGTKTVSP